MRSKRNSCTFLIALAFILPLHAQDEEPQRFVITADGQGTDTRSVSSHVTVITADEIEKSAARNIAEILASAPGIHISRYGGITEPALVSIRGSSPEQVLVLINGKRLNTAQGGGVDFSTISPDDIERIEILRGGASAIYGENALGGVINIITKDGYGKKPQASVKASVGTETTLEGGAQGQGSFWDGLLDFFVSASARTTEGSYSYEDLRTQSGSTERKNADGKKIDASLKIGTTPLRGLHIALTGQAHADHKGVPGMIEFPSRSARMKDMRALGMLSLTWKDDANRFSADGVMLKQRRHYADPEFFLGGIDDYHDNTAYSTELAYSRGDAFSWLILKTAAGYSYRYDHLISTALIKVGGAEDGSGQVYRHQHSAYIRPELHLFPYKGTDVGIVSIFPSLRYDWNNIKYKDDGIDKINAALSYNVGLLIPVGPAKKAVFKGNVGTSYRAPSFDDLFWPATSFAMGNPNLKPENAFVYDVGVIIAPWPFISMEAVFFTYAVKNLIQWNPGPTGQWRPINIGRALLRGGELEIKSLIPISAIRTNIEIKGNVTLLQALDLTKGFATYGKTLLRRPWILSNVSVTLCHDEGHYIRLEGRYVGFRYATSQNTKYYPAYFVLDINANIQLRENLNIIFALKNALNAKFIDIREYPIPGAEFFFGIGYTYK